MMTVEVHIYVCVRIGLQNQNLHNYQNVVPQEK